MDTAAEPVSPELLRQVRERYGVGPRYAEAYLAYWRAVRGERDDSLDQVLARPQPEPMWFEFALSTNMRARDFHAAYAEQLGVSGGRYLDVGCGFGGYLVAFAERGFEVLGLELDPQRVVFSRANCADAGLDGCVHEGSILDEPLVAGLGKFDVVTCIDVIEHVLDVPATLGALAGLLAPGGVLLLEIPNKDSLAFVRSDGHFELFGITQLPRELAIEYHRHFFGFEYDVGDYHLLEDYVSMLSAHGLECAATPSPFHPTRRCSRELLRLLPAWRQFRRSRGRALSPELRREVEQRVGRVARAAAWGALAAGAGLRDQAAFRLRYLCDFWTLLARAPSP